MLSSYLLEGWPTASTVLSAGIQTTYSSLNPERFTLGTQQTGFRKQKTALMCGPRGHHYSKTVVTVDAIRVVPAPSPAAYTVSVIIPTSASHYSIPIICKGFLSLWIRSPLARGPLPDIAGHVERSARGGTGRVATNRDDVARAAGLLVLLGRGMVALPVLAPRIVLGIAAARGGLPLLLGGQTYNHADLLA